MVTGSAPSALPPLDSLQLSLPSAVTPALHPAMLAHVQQQEASQWQARIEAVSGRWGGGHSDCKAAINVIELRYLVNLLLCSALRGA